MAGNQKYDTPKLIEKFKSVHGDTYDYSKTEYVGYKKKVTVTCPEHGDFQIDICHHMQGQGCPVCRHIKSAAAKRKSVDEVKAILKEKRGDEYDYSLITEYKNGKTKIPIVCREHGVFWQSFDNHVRFGHGCPKCGIKKYGEHQRLTTEEFIKKARDVHGEKYDYSKTEYALSRENVTITCPEHGDFNQIARNHLMGAGCPKCFFDKSGVEREVLDFITGLVGTDNVVENDRTVLDGKEIDILIPSVKIGFEVDGLVWHSEKFEQDRNAMLDKVVTASNKGVKLIHIFEDDWNRKKHVVESRIRNMLHMPSHRAYARKCTISEVPYHESKLFLEQHHLQGNCPSKHRYGLFLEDELIALMTFSRPRRNVSRSVSGKDGEYEMTRFCTKTGWTVVGAASRLFKRFVSEIRPKSVISYADRCWSDGNLYETLGFKKYNESKPSYAYVVNKRRVNRFNMRKDVLVSKYGCPADVTEHEFCLSKGWYRIYDCGCLCYRWISPE